MDCQIYDWMRIRMNAYIDAFIVVGSLVGSGSRKCIEHNTSVQCFGNKPTYSFSLLLYTLFKLYNCYVH